MDASREIHVLAQALNLENTRQDWGITNSDPSRVAEFIRFCETTELTPVQQFAMGELVLASANDALVEGVADEGLIDIIERFLASGLHGLPAHFGYWSSLDDEEEFPIGSLLRRLATHASP